MTQTDYWKTHPYKFYEYLEYCSKWSHPDGYKDVGDKGMNFEIRDILQMLVPDADFQREDASS